MEDKTSTHILYNVYRYVPYENGFVSILPKEERFMTSCCDAPLACDKKYLEETAKKMAKEYGTVEDKSNLPARWLTFNVHVVEFIFDAELTEVVEARPFNKDFFQIVLKHIHR